MSQPVITEEWRKIPGFRAIYRVSNFGEVRSNSNVARGKTLKSKPDKFSGFPQVRVVDSQGQKRWWPVHELVAKAFPEDES
jgi:hypothetical protein